MSAFLTREAIKSSIDMPTEELPLPAWGGKVVVKAAPIANARFQAFMYSSGKKGAPPSVGEVNIRRNIGAAILCTLDEAGEQLFSWSDAEWLREKRYNQVLRIAETAFRLAGPAPEAPPAAIRRALLALDGTVDELERYGYENEAKSLSEAFSALSELWEQIGDVDFSQEEPVDADPFPVGEGDPA